jgi:Dockerin type I domain
VRFLYKLNIYSLLLLIILSTALYAADSSVLKKIESDFNSGEISYAESLLYQLMSVRAPEELPERYGFKGIIIERSATPILLEVERNMDKLTPFEQETFKQFRNRPPATHSYDSPSGIFKIHYNTEGGNAVDLSDTDPANGIPDYVDRVALYIDSSWQYENIHLGYKLPPSDNDAGGDSLYDIYLLNIPYYGYTQPEAFGPEPWDDYISFMGIHNSFFEFPTNDDPAGDQIGAIKATCAHEYFHAIQYAYTYLADVWFMESSSTWMEEIVFPEVNDNYNYIDSFFLYPHCQLNSTDKWHHYSAFVWNRFLDHSFDTTIIRDVWDGLLLIPDAYSNLDIKLQDRGSDLSSAVSEFAAWNWCTNSRDDGVHYEDGSEYPLIEAASNIVFYPTGWTVPPTDQKPGGLSSNYICFNNPEETIGDLLIWFDGNDIYEWHANVILAGQGNDFSFTEIPLNSAAVGSLLVTDIETYDYVILNPVVESWYADSADYQFSANLLPLTPFAVEVVEDGPYEIYSQYTRTVDFKIHNRGSANESFSLSVADELGWGLELHDTIKPVFYKDSASVSVDLFSGPGLALGTINNIILTATSMSADTISSTDSLPIGIVRFNGDSNNDGTINVSDAVYIINYVFAGGSEPVPELYSGDANCDDLINVSDAVFIINYVFTGGPAPPCLIY